MSGSLYRGGVNYSNGGAGTPATEISFYPGTSGLTSKNVNSAILELATIVNNAVKQFVVHDYTYPNSTAGQTLKAFFKKALKEASREAGAFHVLNLVVDTKTYIGFTTTVGTNCSFTIHSTDVPENIYYGYFDNMSTETSFVMYKAGLGEENLFDKEDSEFSI